LNVSITSGFFEYSIFVVPETLVAEISKYGASGDILIVISSQVLSIVLNASFNHFDYV